MSQAQLEIQAIAVVVSVACALPGVFLVLRRMAMLSDAISHAILVGIVVAFFLTRDLGSPFLVLGAALTGVLTVTLVELIFKTRLLKEDASIGIVFPLLFSIGVILVSRFASHIHLDTDAVLLGELAFATFDRFYLFGIDVGPKSLWIMSGILFLNIVFISLFFKELKLSTFDSGLAATLGLAPATIHYSLMGLVSITTVGAFDAVGSILVVALMIIPPATAYLLTSRLSLLIGLSVGIGMASAISGYWVAHALDASIAGSMATMTGILFGLALLFSPGRGLVSIARRRASQRIEFSVQMLTVHLSQHIGTPEEREETELSHLQDHFRWTPAFSSKIIQSATRKKVVRILEDRLVLTSEGETMAKTAMMR